MRTLMNLSGVLTVTLTVVLAEPVFAEPKYGPGVTDTEIRIGNTMPYSGHTSAYGTIGRSMSAYFDMINDHGGVNGRRIVFLSQDDGYTPPKTVEQVRKLVEKDQVLLLFGMLGTPTNSAIHKYVNAKEVPHLFIMSGATKWGQPDHFPWTMGWMPPYGAEAKSYARYVLKNVEYPRIAVLYQNDDYGKDYLENFKAGLGGDANHLIVLALPYETTDPTVDSHIVTLKQTGANVFFNISGAKFAAQAIRKAYDIGWEPMQFLNSTAASVKSVLEPAGLEKSKGIISAAFIKDPRDPQWASSDDFQEWSEWMDTYNSAANKGEIFNVWGYAAAALMIHVLQESGDDLSRKNIMSVAADLKQIDLPMLLPGITINTSATDFYPIEDMQLIKFNGETWVMMNDATVVD